MIDKMKPGDYINVDAITSEAELNQIREAVKSMGWRVSDYYGTWEGKRHGPYLNLHGDGDLFWNAPYLHPKGREWTLKEVMAWQPATASIDWSDRRIPDWVVAITMDKSGEAVGHERRPSMQLEMWGSWGSLVTLPHLDGYASNWEESLVARPAEDATDHDPVDRPSHYTSGAIECIEAIEAALGTRGALDYCRGCAIKYHWRMMDKGGAEDARKAAWYSTRAAELLDKMEGDGNE